MPLAGSLASRSPSNTSPVCDLGQVASLLWAAHVPSKGFVPHDPAPLPSPHIWRLPELRPVLLLIRAAQQVHESPVFSRKPCFLPYCFKGLGVCFLLSCIPECSSSLPTLDPSLGPSLAAFRPRFPPPHLCHEGMSLPADALTFSLPFFLSRVGFLPFVPGGLQCRDEGRLHSPAPGPGGPAQPPGGVTADWNERQGEVSLPTSGGQDVTEF